MLGQKRAFKSVSKKPAYFSLGAFHWNSLWVIISAVTLGISLAAVLAISQIVYQHADSAINLSIVQNNSQIVSNVADSIGSYIDEMVAVSERVTEMLSDDPEEKLNDRLVVFLREDIETIAVFGTDGSVVMCTDSRPLRKDIQVVRQSWFTGATASHSGHMVSAPHVQRLFRGEYRWVITLTRGVSWMHDGELRRGIIMVDMNFTRIRDLCTRDLENDGYLYITNPEGEIVYHPKQQMIYAGILPKEITLTTDLSEGNSVVGSNDGKLAVSVKTLSNTAWRMIGVTSLNGLKTYDNGPKNDIWSAIFMLVGALLAGSLAISRYMVRPIHRLMALMGRMSDGEVELSALTGGIYEVRQLSDSFNHMVLRIHQLVGQVRNEQEQLRRSELKTLYAQINPHFLYNTLDSVIWLAESGDQKNVVQMVMALSKYFRLSLSGAKDFISVKEEIQQVENYLIIQKMRFGGVFEYRIVCEEEVSEAKTPKIMLQPIVENAIVHGVGTLYEGGLITIRAFRQDNELVMEVHDNGFGIKPGILSRILEVDRGSSSGIGLKNVHQRIKLTCGLEYGLELESELDEGTAVRMRLPLKFDSPDKEANG